MAKPAPRIARQSITCFSCKTCESAEWAALNEEELKQIDGTKVTRSYRPGDVIYEQGEACTGMFCIESGTVAIRQTTSEGDSKIVRTVEAGQTIGYADFFGGQEYRTGAYCLREATVCHISREALKNLLARSPALGLAFLSHGAQDLQEADTNSMRQSLYSVRMRIAHLLLKFKDAHGTSGPSGDIVLTMPMSWQEAADMIAARPETVSRAVQGLAKDGVIRIEGRMIHIRDLDLLLDEVENRESEESL